MLKRDAIISFIPARLSWNRANPKAVGVKLLNRDKISLEDRVKLIGDVESLHTFAHIINRTRRRDIGNFTLRKPETLKVSFTPEQQERFDRQDGDLYNERYFDDSPY